MVKRGGRTLGCVRRRRVGGGGEDLLLHWGRERRRAPQGHRSVSPECKLGNTGLRSSTPKAPAFRSRVKTKGEEQFFFHLLLSLPLSHLIRLDLCSSGWHGVGVPHSSLCWLHTCVHTSTHNHTHTCAKTCTQLTHTGAKPHTCTCKHSHIHTHKHTYTHTQTCTHSHTHVQNTHNSHTCKTTHRCTLNTHTHTHT